MECSRVFLLSLLRACLAPCFAHRFAPHFAPHSPSHLATSLPELFARGIDQWFHAVLVKGVLLHHVDEIEPYLERKGRRLGRFR